MKKNFCNLMIVDKEIGTKYVSKIMGDSKQMVFLLEIKGVICGVSMFRHISTTTKTRDFVMSFLCIKSEYRR